MSRRLRASKNSVGNSIRTSEACLSSLFSSRPTDLSDNVRMVIDFKSASASAASSPGGAFGLDCSNACGCNDLVSSSAIVSRRLRKTSLIKALSLSSSPVGELSLRTTITTLLASGSSQPFRNNSSAIRLGESFGRKANSPSAATSFHGGAAHFSPTKTVSHATNNSGHVRDTNLPSVSNIRWWLPRRSDPP